jgi:hypothetical protein
LCRRIDCHCGDADYQSEKADCANLYGIFSFDEIHLFALLIEISYRDFGYAPLNTLPAERSDNNLSSLTLV